MGNRALRIILRVVLAVSLVLNALLLGILLRLNAVRAEMGLSLDILTRAERVEFRRTAIGDEALRAALRDVRAARQAAFELLTAEPVDRAAAEAAMVEVRAATDAVQREAQRVLIDVVSDE